MKGSRQVYNIRPTPMLGLLTKGLLGLTSNKKRHIIGRPSVSWTNIDRPKIRRPNAVAPSRLLNSKEKVQTTRGLPLSKAARTEHN